MALAEANQTPVPAIGEEALVEISSNPAAPLVAQVQSAPLSVEVPAKHEPEAASVETPVLLEAEVETVPVEQLPSTGSWMPTIGLLGLFSIGIAGMLRFAVNRGQ